MSQYRRLRVPGGTYYFSTHLQNPGSDLLVQEIDRLRKATRQTLARYPTRIDAIVVLPNAIHTIWTLPDGDSNYSDRWAMLKSLFSRDLPAPETRSNSHQRSRTKGIWQRRFWEHCLKNQDDYDAHITRIHNAPVHMGLVTKPHLWPYSSIHRERQRRTHKEAPHLQSQHSQSVTA